MTYALQKSSEVHIVKIKENDAEDYATVEVSVLGSFWMVMQEASIDISCILPAVFLSLVATAALHG